MPFYEYECTNCKFYSEVMQRISEPPLKKCPSCGKSTMKKLVSAPNFRLKGGGWYETDFKSEQENKRNLALEKEPDGKPAAEAKAPDATPDAKAFRRRDLDVVHVIPIPDRLKHRVAEAKHEDVLNRVFAEIVIDAIDLALFENFRNGRIKRLRRLEVAAEGLFDNDAAPVAVFFIESGFTQTLHDR